MLMEHYSRDSRFEKRFPRGGLLELREESLNLETGRVESNGKLAPVPLLLLVKPDVRISRIRLSCKHSS
jgi:hypothetical protein